MTAQLRVGELTVHVWRGTEPDAPVAIAAHGITANGLCWARVADLLDGRVTLIAPDLRGRAGSRQATGPYGIARHADDVAGVLDDLGVPEAVVVGHSMGGFVAAATAVRHPWRTTAVVLIDGGFTLPMPPDMDPDQVLAAILGPALERLSMTFPTRQAYREFWQAHPAFAGEWAPWIDAYIQYDLVGAEPPLSAAEAGGPFRSSCVIEAVRRDGREVLDDPETLAAVNSLPCPGVLLYAERGLLNQTPGLYDAERLAGLALPSVLVADTNHYSILVSDKGAGAVADHIARAAGVRD